MLEQERTETQQETEATLSTHSLALRSVAQVVAVVVVVVVLRPDLVVRPVRLERRAPLALAVLAPRAQRAGKRAVAEASSFVRRSRPPRSTSQRTAWRAPRAAMAATVVRWQDHRPAPPRWVLGRAVVAVRAAAAAAVQAARFFLSPTTWFRLPPSRRQPVALAWAARRALVASTRRRRFTAAWVALAQLVGRLEQGQRGELARYTCNWERRSHRTPRTERRRPSQVHRHRL